jgi:hypothetical protein
MVDFFEFEKIPRLSRMCVVTEKIDGTNAQIYIGEDGEFLTGSRKRWITPEDDNYGFARWAQEHKEELLQLGVGRHFGEWWGSGIQRRYGLSEKRFSLFNTGRLDNENTPACCHVVPVLYEGIFDTFVINGILKTMEEKGSRAAPGFMDPEGVVIYHVAARQMFKKTIKGDESPKGVM